jgi:hypothetical protein
VSSVVKRKTRVASLGFTALKIAGIAVGMTTSIAAFPLSKSKLFSA